MNSDFDKHFSQLQRAVNPPRLFRRFALMGALVAFLNVAVLLGTIAGILYLLRLFGVI